MTILQDETIHDEFLSKTDRQYLAELVGDWLAENNHTPESFEFSVRVQWQEGEQQCQQHDWHTNGLGVTYCWNCQVQKPAS